MILVGGSKNEAVRIYADPLTKHCFEGEAKLIRRLPEYDQHGLELQGWLVKFKGADGIERRWLHVYRNQVVQYNHVALCELCGEIGEGSQGQAELAAINHQPREHVVKIRQSRPMESKISPRLAALLQRREELIRLNGFAYNSLSDDDSKEDLR